MAKKTLPISVAPRFPAAVMHWYAQYSDKESGRAGSIEYAMSLTPGLTEESAGVWIDKLIAESGTKTEDEKTEQIALTLAPA